jgi:hypothetical protein
MPKKLTIEYIRGELKKVGKGVFLTRAIALYGKTKIISFQ